MQCAARRGKRSYVILVVTKCDHLKPMEFPHIELDEHESLKLDTLTERQKSNSKQQAEFTEHAKALRQNKEHTAARHLQTQALCLKDKNRTLSNKIANLYLCARNNNVKKSMRAIWQETHGQIKAPLRVFCISSFAYKEHIQMEDGGDPPPMTIANTGVPELKRFLFSVPSEARFRAASRYIELHLPLVLDTMATSCSASKFQLQQGMSDILRRNLEVFKKNFAKNFDNLVKPPSDGNSVGLETILRAIEEDDSMWASRLRRKFDNENWLKLNHATFRGFCKRNGTWKRKGVETCWNKAIVDVINLEQQPKAARRKKPVEGINRPFNALESAWKSFDTDMVENLVPTISSIESDMSSKLLLVLESPPDSTL
ncbi:hypothetical protein K402DRAFT_191319 [Aulographum hederae CBS 113979]|uniref:Uncharacterized protein n=1 Tax=Aulographum hederae CBS 113979 TaxID=1176131 RepID=A0A6G1GP92_9PEZI|nr:hypothetical protein K402DRAFT_191319 [Aulographum hederae CBS 113979]